VRSLSGRDSLRACPKIARGPAARDFGCGQGGEVRASPTRAVRTEPTQATDKRPAARRVFAPKAAWLRCSSVEDPGRIFSFVAPRHPAFGAKTGPRGIFGHALSGHGHEYDDVRCAQFGLGRGATREHSRELLCDRGATKPQAKFGATRRAAVHLRPDFVARSLQTVDGYARRSRLVWPQNPLPRTSSYLCP